MPLSFLEWLPQSHSLRRPIESGRDLTPMNPMPPFKVNVFRRCTTALAPTELFFSSFFFDTFAQEFADIVFRPPPVNSVLTAIIHPTSLVERADLIANVPPFCIKLAPMRQVRESQRPCGGGPFGLKGGMPGNPPGGGNWKLGGRPPCGGGKGRPPGAPGGGIGNALPPGDGLGPPPGVMGGGKGGIWKPDPGRMGAGEKRC